MVSVDRKAGSGRGTPGDMASGVFSPAPLFREAHAVGLRYGQGSPCLRDSMPQRLCSVGAVSGWTMGGWGRETMLESPLWREREGGREAQKQKETMQVLI